MKSRTTFQWLIALVAISFSCRPAPADEFVGPFANWKNAKKDYGAVGDGVADDTAALQAALNGLSSHPETRTLFLPAGIYRITSGLVVKTHQNVSVEGADPAATKIKWDGPAGGVMLWSNGVRYSRMGRITWDGSGKALSAIDDVWDGHTPGAATGNEHADEVFEDVGFGIRGGMPHNMDAEMTVLRCKFLRCSKAGLCIDSMNALDWWVWNCLFDGCRVGATNIPDGEYGGGHFHICDSVFHASTESDITIGHTSYFGIRHNVSTDSQAFLIAKRPGMDRGKWKDTETWGSELNLQNNAIIHPIDPTPIQLSSNGPTFLLDNVIQSRPEVQAGPVVREIGPGGPSDLISIGNTYTVPNPLEVQGRVYTQDDQIVDGAKLHLHGVKLEGAQPAFARQVITVPANSDGAAIQTAIDQAAKANGQRPIVLLAPGGYKIAQSLVLPVGSDLQLVGDGYSTILQWTGIGPGPVLRLQGPSHATLRDFEINCGPPIWNPKPDTAAGIAIENCDQPGARVFMQEPQVENFAQTGFLIDHLAHTQVSLCDVLQSDCQVGIEVIGAGRRGDGSVGLFGGVVNDNHFAYEIREGGNLLARDAWTEGTPPTYIHLADSGAFTLSGAGISPGRPGPNMSQTDPNFAGVEVDNFAGTVGIFSTMFSTHMIVHGEGAKTDALVLGDLAEEGPDTFADNSPHARFLVLDSQLSVPSGSVPVPDLGKPDPEFIRRMLASLREIEPSPLGPLPAGVTDVRCYRVWTRFGSVGFHLSGK